MSICDLTVISIHAAFVIASVLLVTISQAPTRCWSFLVLYHLVILTTALKVKVVVNLIVQSVENESYTDFN